ncbi:UNVERIFIED_CONTAM: hypothetical protein Slati_1532800 [Sesamum latifolium]|uniref:J domain-containing protein n=1 Tax=Sesamum latifolium TaxID=2727402 RepID=A0AAW2X6L8_9LAMI
MLQSLFFTGFPDSHNIMVVRRLMEMFESFAKIEADYADQLNKKSRIKSARQAKRASHKKLKRKHRKENMFEENPERIFRATFGKQGFTWTFRPSEMGFDWTGSFGWGVVDLMNRTVKLMTIVFHCSFRLSALKWHPDKHQGSSRADAEEKFKHCVNAYKSLCDAFSTS